MVHPYEKEQKGYPRRRRRIYRFRRYKREIDNTISNIEEQKSTSNDTKSNKK